MKSAWLGWPWGESVSPNLAAPGARREGPPRKVGLADRRRGGLEPALRPLRHGCEDRLQRVTSRGESIAHAHRRTRIDEALDDAFRLELSKSLGQHSITDAWNAGEQLIE